MAKTARALEHRAPARRDEDTQGLIREAQSGDQRAFESLYHRFKRKVYGICFRMVSNAAEAEDLTQDVFLQVYRKIATFRGEAAFSTWLHRLAVNAVLMKLRRARIPTLPLDDDSDDRSEGAAYQLSCTDRVLAGSVDRMALETAIAGLPPGYRVVFILHDVEGYQHGDIAEMMGCTVGNCKSQLHKARMRIRERLSEAVGEPASRRKRRRNNVVGITVANVRPAGGRRNVMSSAGDARRPHDRNTHGTKNFRASRPRDIGYTTTSLELLRDQLP